MARRRHPGVRQLSSGRFQARPTLHGRQFSLGTFATAKQARDAIEQARVEHREGRFIDPGNGRITLGDFAQAWLDGRVSIADGTRRSYEVTFRSLDWLGQVELGDLTPTHVRRRIAEWSARLAPNSVRLRHTHLKTALDAAVDEQRMARNPARHRSVELPRGGRVKAHRYLTPTEVENVAGRLPPLHADLTWLMAWSGFRIHEALGLTADQVDLAAGRFRLVRQWDPRAKRTAPLKARTDETTVRQTPIAPDLAPIVQSRLGVGYLFPSPSRPGMPVSAASYADRLDLACDRAGVARFTPHDLRHTCASWLHAVGVSIEEAAVWLGHRNSSITAGIYTHLWPSQMDAAAVRLGGIRSVELGEGVTQLDSRRQA